MSSFWYFWLPAIVILSILVGLCEYTRWQWASRLMEEIERGKP